MPTAAQDGGNLGVKIADDRIWQPNVGAQELFDGAVAEVAFQVDLHRRDNDPFR